MVFLLAGCGGMDSLMSYLGSLNRKFRKMFDGQVEAHEDGDCLVLTGELSRWSDVVFAGMTAVRKTPYFGLVNDIVCTGEARAPMRKPRIEDSSLEKYEVDVLIIGGGVIGCAIARELSRYKLSVLLVEKEHDVAVQTSGRNDGMIHSGIDLKKSSQKYKYNKLGNPMFDRLCAELGVDFDRCGQYLCFANRLWEPLMFLSLIYWKWLGLKGVKVIGRDDLHRLEPAIDPSIRSALFFPDTGVLCPFSLTIAYAENAAHNGVEIFFDTMVTGMVTEDNVIKSVKTNRGTILPKVVVNAAGVFCDDIATLAGDRFYTIHPRKGTTAILDKKYADDLVQTSISSIGTVAKKKKHTKGGGVIRTIDGNILVGPDAVEVRNKEDFTTNILSIKDTFSAHSRTCPELDESQIITYFSGIRAATYEEDFIVSKGRYVSNMVHAAGIQSPGLTAAPAISVDVAHMVLDLFGGENVIGENPDFNPVRTPPPRPSTMDDEARAEFIEMNPDYGIIVCRCEEISKGEILNALRRDVKCSSIDGVKRRVRPGMGRCQGGFCGPQVLELIAAEKRALQMNVRKGGIGSEIVFGTSKTILEKRVNAGTAARMRESVTDSETEMLLRKRAAERFSASKSGQGDEGDDYDDE